MFLRNDLDELLACEARPAVSIYLPTHKAGREIRQDSIRLRNLLRERPSGSAPTGAVSGGRGPARAGAPARRGRRILAPSGARSRDLHRAGLPPRSQLPIEVAEEVAVGRHFCIRPLLPIVDPTGWFWLLTITAGRTRLYRGSRWAIGEVGGIDLPQGIEEIYNETVFQEQHYASPTARP